MKVVFKLTTEQQFAAAEQAAYVTTEREDAPVGWKNRGNLLTSGYGTNPNQYLVWENDTITYEGDREPFRNDGAREALAHIAGYDTVVAAVRDGFRRLAVTEYRTADRLLKWWE